MVLVSVGVSFGAKTVISASDVAVMEHPTGEERDRVLLKFDFSSLPSTAAVDFALIRVVADIDSAENSVSSEVGCFLVTTDWSSGSVGWTGGWTNPGGDFGMETYAGYIFPVGKGNAGWFDITDWVQKWRAETVSNYGVIMMGMPGMEGDFTLGAPRGTGKARTAPVCEVFYTPLAR
jgi:hypothetical protein